MVYEVTKHNDVNHILACPRIYYRGPYKFTEIASPDLEVFGHRQSLVGIVTQWLVFLSKHGC